MSAIIAQAEAANCTKEQIKCSYRLCHILFQKVPESQLRRRQTGQRSCKLLLVIKLLKAGAYPITYIINYNNITINLQCM